MQELKDRIVKEGKVLPGNIIKVDGFLNHRIDTELMDHIAEEFGKHFNMDEVTMILTAEASGIALSAIVAHHFHKPMIFAKKAKSDNIEGGLYQSDIFSYTYKKKVTLLVSKEWLHESDRVLIIDDFMANGEAMRGLCDIVTAAGAELVFTPFYYDVMGPYLIPQARSVGFDGILLGGGMVHNPALVQAIRQGCGWIAPVYAYPGEFEMEAMAAGALRVLSGQEQAKRYTGRPAWTPDSVPGL